MNQEEDTVHEEQQHSSSSVEDLKTETDIKTRFQREWEALTVLKINSQNQATPRIMYMLRH